MDFLRKDERIALGLRGLFHERGYRYVTPGRFEEYGLYLDNKYFLDTDSFITFMDADGKLMALKPDVTLSIIKNLPPDPGVRRLYYCDDVYRRSSEQRAYTVLRQAGVECVAPSSPEVNAEIMELALDSLALISKNSVLDVSHLGFVSGLLDSIELSETDRRALLAHLHAKNTWDMALILEGASAVLKDSVLTLAALRGPLSAMLDRAKELVQNPAMAEAYEQLSSIPAAENVRLDFSLAADLDYYNGLIFRGYVDGIPSVVLSGGRYDNLMKRMGKRSDAIGFAVTLNETGYDNTHNGTDNQCVSIALPKGRLGKKSLELLAKAGYPCPEISDKDRRLVIENGNIRYFLVKPADVAIYVARGAADIGIVGKDVLLETEPDIYELLNLGLGKCRVAIAAPSDYSENQHTALRVATKYPNIAKRYYASLSRDIELIHLNGSIELAPLLGLSDVIVDIVETGGTLRQNNLKVLDTVAEISARLIANKASYQFKAPLVDAICRAVKEVLP